MDRMKLSGFIIIIIFSFKSYGQQFLNGSFEFNKATTSDLINQTTPQFNQNVDSCKSFGIDPGLDLIRSVFCGDTAQDARWYMGMTGMDEDAFSIKLDAYLSTGRTYTISFYDRFCDVQNYNPRPILIGLSLIDTVFGTVIYNDTSYLPTNIWTKRTFSFTAPNNGNYITVKVNSGAQTRIWMLVDNFKFETLSGIFETELDNTISLYPNPTTGKVYIKNNDAIKTTRIIDLTGRLLLSQDNDVNQKTIEINLDKLSAGIYIVNATTFDNKTMTAKLIVQN